MLAQMKTVLQLLPRGFAQWFKGAFVRAMFDRYHPEQHYMRGSGPKCRLKDAKQNARSE
jgi:hypothetical protein